MPETDKTNNTAVVERAAVKPVTCLRSEKFFKPLGYDPWLVQRSLTIQTSRPPRCLLGLLANQHRGCFFAELIVLCATQ